MRALPYPVPSSSVAPESWTLSGSPVTTVLPGWDYESLLQFERVVRVDVLKTVKDAGLDPEVPLALHVRYWATGSYVRRSAVLEPLVPDATTGWAQVLLVAPVDGRELAGDLVLETTLVRVDEAEVGGFTARRAGSVLWNDTTKLALEGSGGLLPIAPVRFSEQGLPAAAAWYVSLDGSDWAAPAMGNLLVLLNVDNRAVADALDPGNTAAASLWDTLTVDVVCDLVGRALDDEEYEPTQDDAGELSTGELVTNLIRSFLSLPGEGVTDAVLRLRDERRHDPSRVRAQAQSSLRFPRTSS
ncbi:hypothetical protein [Cellulosimicrobium cellulans]|uniref:hypothetical protein n=1 Tax=Cellulosimicrobium cellulans TaxID=1710 RepID=UPI0016526487|nr:hypothetical protein [Cellulosimicrobium cellulans]